MTRYDHRTKQTRDISVWPEAAGGWPAQDLKYRFQWTFPIVLSPHDPKVVLAAGNYVFRSTNEGDSWEKISPDLTRNEKSRMGPSGGPITKDLVGTEYYGTIFAFAESPHQQGLFWAGSDDGLLHISHDGGQNWQNITPGALPEWALVSVIEPSPHDPATAYLAATRYKLDDFQPYLYKTNDYGKTCTKITQGIAENAFTRVIREDPTRRGLLYAGTETGILVSFDDGEHWQSLKCNLPIVPIHDLAVKDTDLIAATHGRAFWILDDITPLRQAGEDVQNSPSYLFTPRPTIRFMTNYGYARAPESGKYYRGTGTTMITARVEQQPGGNKVERNPDAGQNPPNGVIVSYYLKEKPKGEVKLTFLDAQGKEIHSFTSEVEPEPAEDAEPATFTDPPADTDETLDTMEEEQESGEKGPPGPKEACAKRLFSTIRDPDRMRVQGYVASEATLAGPLVPPGVYRVQLTVGDETLIESFEIQKDPRIAATQEDLEAQFDLRMQIHNKLSQTHDAINTLRNIRRQVDDWEHRTQELPDHEA